VFHITAIDNLKSIADKGAIVSKNCIAEAGLTASDIAYEEVQGLRAAKLIQEGPKGSLSNHVGSGGTLHNYVPFYFAPRSPMLFAINNGNVAGCDYRQDDIVHLVSNAQAIRAERAAYRTVRMLSRRDSPER
jgi:ssDNA thymidine ADP-ribosyltransferase, DarT